MTHAAGARPGWWTSAAIYCALTVVYAWPLLRVLGSALPNDVIDPALISWGLWWNTQAWPLTDQWWSAPMFFPLPGMFALSENFLGLAPVSTPLLWLGLTPVATHNVLYLISFPVTALAAHALTHRLTGRHDVALIAGLATAFSPVRASQMPHLHLLSAWWMLFGLLALHSFLDRQRWSALVLFGACWLLNALTSGYFLIFYAVVVGGWMLWFLRTRREWGMAISAVVAASVPLAPVMLGYSRHQHALGLSRSAAEIEAFSADLQAYWTASRHLWVPRHWSFSPRAEGELYPGVVVLLVVLGGGLWIWRNRATRLSAVQRALFSVAIATFVAGLAFTHQWFSATTWLVIAGLCLDYRVRDAWTRHSTLGFFVAMAGLLVVLSLGPVGRVTDIPFLQGAPYGWLAALPGGDSIRVPARFGILASLCLVQAMALMLARLFPGGLRASLLAGLAVAVLADGWVPDLPAVPLRRTMNIAAFAPPGTSVLELPMREPFADAAAILHGTQHRRPVVNGYSGYAPPHYAIIQRGIRAGDAGVLAVLRSFGPLTVVVHREDDENGTYAAFVAAAPDAQRVASSTVGTVFTFSQLPPITPRPSSPVKITSADANLAFVDAARMIDGRLDTIWTSEGLQLPGMEVSFTFAPTDLSRFEMDLAEHTRNFPRAIRVRIEDEQGRVHEVWQGGTAGAALLGALNDPKRTTIAIELPAGVRARKLTIALTEGDGFDPWRIAEFRIFGS